MSDIELTYRQAYIYVIIVGAMLGALLGLLPLLMGRRKNRGRLGVYGFIASTVGGAIAPLLAIVIAAIFTWLTVREKPATSSDTPKAGDDSESASE